MSLVFLFICNFLPFNFFTFLFNIYILSCRLLSSISSLSSLLSSFSDLFAQAFPLRSCVFLYLAHLASSSLIYCSLFACLNELFGRLNFLPLSGHPYVCFLMLKWQPSITLLLGLTFNHVMILELVRHSKQGLPFGSFALNVAGVIHHNCVRTVLRFKYWMNVFLLFILLLKSKGKHYCVCLHNFTIYYLLNHSLS